MKKLKIFLIISCVLNLFCIGIIAGYLSHCFMGPFGHPPQAHIEDLPENKRILVEATLKSAWEDTDTLRTQITAAKKEATDLLQAEPVNRTAYLTQVDHINDLRSQLKRHMAQALLNIVQQLTPEERVILADIIAHTPAPEKPLAASDKNH